MIKDSAASKLFRRFKHRSAKTVVRKLGVKYKLRSSSREVLIGVQRSLMLNPFIPVKVIIYNCQLVPVL